MSKGSILASWSLEPYPFAVSQTKVICIVSNIIDYQSMGMSEQSTRQCMQQNYSVVIRQETIIMPNMLTCTIQKGSLQGVSMRETLSKLDSWLSTMCLLRVVNHNSNIVYNYFKINGCILMNVLHKSLTIRWHFNLLFTVNCIHVQQHHQKPPCMVIYSRNWPKS